MPLKAEESSGSPETFSDMMKTLALFRSAGDLFISDSNLPELVKRISLILSNQADCPDNAIIILEREQFEFNVLLAEGLEAAHFPKKKAKITAQFLQAVETEQAIFFPKETLPDNFPEFDPSIQAYLILPLINKKHLLGFVCLAFTKTGPLKHEKEAMETFTRLCAVAIENTLIQEELARVNQGLEKAIESRTEELRDTQKKMLQSAKLVSIGQLAGGVAHEVNNPMGVIRLRLQLLKGGIEHLGIDDDDKEKLLKHLQLIDRHTDRIKLIIENLQIYSKEGSRQTERVNLSGFIDDTLNLFQDRIEEVGGAKIQIEKEYPGEPVYSDILVDQMGQVLINLIINAVQAMEGTGVLTLSVESLDTERCHFKVRDTGCGIAVEHLSRIFDPFFTTKAVGGGTGLGLSNSYAIIERHGGKILVESKVNKGSTFTVLLPAAIGKEPRSI